MGMPVSSLHPCQVCGEPSLFRLLIHPPSLTKPVVKILRCRKHPRVAGFRAFGWELQLLPAVVNSK